MKYHLNPFSGEPNKCTATVKPCPWGTDVEHFLTEAAARAAYEIFQKEEQFAIHRKESERLIEEYEARNAPEAPPLKEYLSDSEASKIDVNGVKCSNCRVNLTPQQAAFILNEMCEFNCSCGKKIDLYSVSIEVGETKDTFQAFQKENVYTMDWFHSTDAEDWEESLTKESGFYAHAGSHQAAFDRQIAEKYNEHSTSKEGFWLYELKVDESATIADDVAKDENEDYSTKYTPGGSNDLKNDVLRYTNKWEDMASISLVVNSNKLKVKSKRYVSRDEAVKAKSLYNIKPLKAWHE